MRVALFTDTYLPQLNGVSRTLARLVGHLRAGGHEVALVSPRVGEAGADAPLHLRLPGVPVPMYPELLLTRIPGRKERLALEDFGPRVVHCATESVIGWWGRRWALRTGRPLVTSFHTNFPEYAADYGLRLLTPIAWRLLRRFHEPAARTLCPSEETLGELRRRGFHGRLDVWSRGVDSELFAPARRSAAVRARLAPNAAVILLYVGRLAGEKRLDVLVDAFETVRRAEGNRVALVLVGDGPWGERLRRRRTPGMHFTGYLRGAELADAYASADIFAFPSDTETFGNVVVEAMASGLPVVGVDRGGVRTTIDPGKTGLRVTPGDPAAFAEALLRLVRDPALRTRLGREARSRAETMEWGRILDGVLRTYQEVASPPAPSDVRARATR